MSAFMRYLISGFIMLSLGVLIFLLTWNIQPEPRQVETVISDDLLPK